MKVKMVITASGEISLITQEGTFREGVKRIDQVIADLQAEGLDIKLSGPPEQHRHDDEPESATNRQRQKGATTQ